MGQPPGPAQGEPPPKSLENPSAPPAGEGTGRSAATGHVPQLRLEGSREAAGSRHADLKGTYRDGGKGGGAGAVRGKRVCRVSTGEAEDSTQLIVACTCVVLSIESIITVHRRPTVHHPRQATPPRFTVEVHEHNYFRKNVQQPKSQKILCYWATMLSIRTMENLYGPTIAVCCGNETQFAKCFSPEHDARRHLPRPERHHPRHQQHPER